MLNALCVDVEYWYCNEYLEKYLPIDKQDELVESVKCTLDLLDEHNTKATFFVLGMVAEKYPEVVKEILDKGHEIGSHSYSHQMLHKLGKEKFKEEIKKSVAILSDITGKPPKGFRAPSFSIDNSTEWALEVLIENGFKYDASVFPMRTLLYGVSKAPLYPYYPSRRGIDKQTLHRNIIEFPATLFSIGAIKIPVAGGFYFRVLPLWFLEFAFKRIQQIRPIILYVHPWEVYGKTHKLSGLPPLSKFEASYGLGNMPRKLGHILEKFKFTPVEVVLYSLGKHPIDKS